MIIVVVDVVVDGAGVDDGLEDDSKVENDELAARIVVVCTVASVAGFGIEFDSQMQSSRGRRIFQ